MTGLLASVTSVEEALAALEGGADVIDLKDPTQGALGALPLAVIRQVVEAVAGRRPVSATLGDLPMQPQWLVDRAVETAASGVDMVKIGLFGRENHADSIRALAPLAGRGVRLIAVLFADDGADFTQLPLLAQSGFCGVMLDTSVKNGQRLTDYLDLRQLADFVAAAHKLAMLAGLAGSLTEADIAPLVSVKPDYLGFRRQLCENHDRNAALNPRLLAQTRGLLHKYNNRGCLATINKNLSCG